MASTIETSLFLFFPVSIYVYTHTHTFFFIFTIHIWVRCPHYFLLTDEDAELKIVHLTSPQFSSVTQSCLTLCDPMNRSTPGLPVLHQLPEFTQTHIHRVSDAIQPSHPLSSPSPPAPNPSQHQSLFQWVNSSHEVAKVLEFQLQDHSLQRNPRADLLQNGLRRLLIWTWICLTPKLMLLITSASPVWLLQTSMFAH